MSTGGGGSSPADTSREVDVGDKDLPLHCPMPGAPLWARHPRVFLDVVKTGHALCPYCGTRFHFKGTAKPHH